jgi:CDGSH-type Zn-finger protein
MEKESSRYSQRRPDESLRMEGAMSKDKKIKVSKNGPYIVTGEIPLSVQEIVPADDGGSEKWNQGRVYGAEDTYALCRCGHSSHKPYCDGTHEKNGFTGEETADRIPYEESAKVYSGETIELLDKENLCAVGRFCDRFGGVWKLTMSSNEKHPEREEMAIYEAVNCPAGRLMIRKNGEYLEPEFEPEIGLVHDLYYDKKGPLAVKGGIALESSDGTEYEKRNRMALCRCGNSSNMPFCDASHLRSANMDGLDDEE